MMKTLLISLVLCHAGVMAQAHLDPDNYPNAPGGATGCNATQQMVDEFVNIYKGNDPYKIRTTPKDPESDPANQRYLAPTIDGFLEPEIWSYAETLIVNSWEDAGVDASCADNPVFTGPRDMHGIWRFCYNHDGLYIGVEVHDDIWDVDSLSGWYGQDGFELGIDPWDWGDKAAGYWDGENPVFRRYYSNNAQVLAKDDNSHLCFLHLLKRLNSEPYIAGLLGGEHRNNYGRGDEATNFRNDELISQYNMAFAIRDDLGVDNWGRGITHAEFRFPYHTALWNTLDQAGGYFDQSGLPRVGTLFKVDIKNNDDDKKGPDGSNPKDNALSRIYRDEPFAIGGLTHWSETKYYQSFTYDGDARIAVVDPVTGATDYHDKRITGAWVDASSGAEGYTFNDVGTFLIEGMDNFYYFDSVDAGGGIIMDQNKSEVGTYTLVKNADNPLNNQLTVSIDGGATVYNLLPLLATGWNEIEGRWLEAELDTNRSLFCGDKPYFKPKADGRELRFSPLNHLQDKGLGAPYDGEVTDSVRIYNGDGSLDTVFTYTNKDAIFGRNYVHFSFEPVKLIDDTLLNAPRQLKVWGSNFVGNAVDTLYFQEYKPFNMTQFGESGNDMNKMVTLSTDDDNTTLQQVRVFNKYKNRALIVDENGDNRFVLFYDDMALSYHYYDENEKTYNYMTTRYYQKLYDLDIDNDSLMLVNYDSSTGIAQSTQEPWSAADTSVSFPDNSWIRTQQTLVFSDTAGAWADTFTFTDTVFLTYRYNQKPGVGVTNTVFPWCIGIEEVASAPVNAMGITNFPNPFNPTTNIHFTVPAKYARARYTLKVFDVRGRLVRTLLKGRVNHRHGLKRTVRWNGMNNAGRKVGSGIYYYRLKCGNKVLQGNMVMVK